MCVCVCVCVWCVCVCVCVVCVCVCVCVDMGAFVDASQASQSSSDKYVQQAKEEGAEVVQACTTTIHKSGKGLFYPLDQASVCLCAGKRIDPYLTILPNYVSQFTSL